MGVCGFPGLQFSCLHTCAQQTAKSASFSLSRVSQLGPKPRRWAALWAGMRQTNLDTLAKLWQPVSHGSLGDSAKQQQDSTEGEEQRRQTPYPARRGGNHRCVIYSVAWRGGKGRAAAARQECEREESRRALGRVELWERRGGHRRGGTRARCVGVCVCVCV